VKEKFWKVIKIDFKWEIVDQPIAAFFERLKSHFVALRLQTILQQRGLLISTMPVHLFSNMATT